jgi:hypothetical protein
VQNVNRYVRRKQSSAQVLLSQWDRQLRSQSEAGQVPEQAAKAAEEDVVEDNWIYLQNVNQTKRLQDGSRFVFVLS